ncbi:MAG: Fe2+-dependent dioxygenase [Myxococcales bacterium]|nr:MAG: Fe2+-dependent dioxygenase [Myxococcales bacterium]
MSFNVVKQLLSPEQLGVLRARLAAGPWVDGRVTAGAEATRVKNNLQLQIGSPSHKELSDVVKGALHASEAFKAIALPRRMSDIVFSRYEVGMEYGLHTDDAYRALDSLRCDVAVTVFLSDLESYEGGALVVGDSAVRLAAGDAIVYPATSIHRVSTVTRGTRQAAVFWVQSLVRDDGKREILYTLQSVIARVGNPALSLALARVQQNLLRMWVE